MYSLHIQPGLMVLVRVRYQPEIRGSDCPVGNTAQNSELLSRVMTNCMEDLLLLFA